MSDPKPTRPHRVDPLPNPPNPETGADYHWIMAADAYMDYLEAQLTSVQGAPAKARIREHEITRALAECTPEPLPEKEG
jgi:hypothetical protein